MNNTTGERVDTTLWVIARYLFNLEMPFAFVTILCLCMSVMLSLFFLYHLWLAMTNVTTNERYKKAALQGYYEDKLEFLQHWS